MLSPLSQYKIYRSNKKTIKEAMPEEWKLMDRASTMFSWWLVGSVFGLYGLVLLITYLI